MMTITEEFANEHVKKWIDAWNDHNLKTVLSMYSDKIEFSSPKIKVVLPDQSINRISNKKDLEKYWHLALKNNFPNLKFTVKKTIFYNNIIILEYCANLDGKRKVNVMEKFQFEGELITKSDVFYGSEDIECDTDK